MTCNCQQYEVYASESAIPRGRAFSFPGDLQRWVDNLREELWWERFYPQVLRVEAAFVRGNASVGGWSKDKGAGRIEMAPGHRCELVVCHELAHVLADARFGSKAHCPWWAKVYLELVYLIMGVKAWTELRDAFVRDGIEFNPEPDDFQWGARLEMPAVT